MKIIKKTTPKEIGKLAAEQAKEIINEAIDKNGVARIVLSTGASQFDFFDAFVKEDIDWTKVEMFHLDEYVGISKNHKASFVKYLTERFLMKLPVKIKSAHLICGEGNVEETIEKISKELNSAPINLGLIGIGENGHIAFNDPPADFEIEKCYKIVDLDDKCKEQQVREGWFKNSDEVCKQAITMTCKQIMKCKNIISIVPYKIKAEAIAKTLISKNTTNLIPATLLKEHENFTLYIDGESASLL